MNIYPEERKDDSLLEEVKRRALEIRKEWEEKIIKK